MFHANINNNTLAFSLVLQYYAIIVDGYVLHTAPERIRVKRVFIMDGRKEGIWLSSHSTYSMFTMSLPM
jgi:hypothetical protein